MPQDQQSSTFFVPQAGKNSILPSPSVLRGPSPLFAPHTIPAAATFTVPRVGGSPELFPSHFIWVVRGWVQLGTVTAVVVAGGFPFPAYPGAGAGRGNLPSTAAVPWQA